MKFENYIGTKIIDAIPMNSYEYNRYCSPAVSLNRNPTEEGYLVKYSDGYFSWSPKETFESAYRKSGSLTFGHALEFLKLGDRVARKSWNGKNRFLFLAEGKQLTNCLCGEGMPPCSDCIWMKTADDRLIPWLASQTDMLAEDWEVIE